MKTVKFFVGAIVSAVLLSATGYATEVKSMKAKSEATVDDFRSQIVNTFSDVTFDNNVDVYLKFSVDEENGFTVKDVVSSDKAFAEIVKSKLSTKSLTIPASLKGTYQIKISFIKNSDLTYKVSNSEVLRSLISEKLSSAKVFAEGSVDVKFSVKSNILTVENVEGKNDYLVKSVESILKNSSVVVPDGINGTYQVKVSF
jgi:hypothetical protein